MREIQKKMLVGHLYFSMNWLLLLRVTFVVRERKRTEDLEGDKTKTTKKAKKKKKGNADKGRFPLSPRLPRTWTVDEYFKELFSELSSE